MRPLTVILDVQHAGRQSKPADMGAVTDLDRDGTRGETGETEVDLVRLYVEAARAALVAEGHEAIVLTTGEYRTRHRQAVALAQARPTRRCAYVACHLNAGGGSYGLVEYDARSNGGATLALLVAGALGRDLPALGGRAITKALAPGERGFTCLSGIYAGPRNVCGILVEPLFLDSAAHRPLLDGDGMRLVGHALAASLAASVA